MNRTRTVSMAIALFAGLLRWAGPVDAQTEPTPVWWAMGDSFSSGEGIPGTDAGPWGRGADGETCERANGLTTGADGATPSDARAYSLVAFEQLYGAAPGSDAFVLTACTGAIGDDWRGQHGQARERSKVFHPDVATLSFGGNDIGFADVLKGCLVGTAGHFGIQPTSGFRLPTRCTVTEAEMKERVDALVGRSDAELAAGQLRLPQLYADLASEMRPGGTVFVLGYPQLIEDPGQWPRASKFLGVCQGIREVDAAMWRSVIGYLNEQIALAVQAADKAAVNGVRFHWVDVSKFYESDDGRHGLCSSDGSTWLNGLTLSISSGDVRKERSFHPNQAGHLGTGAGLTEIIRAGGPGPGSLAVGREAGYPAECGTVPARHGSVDVNIGDARIDCRTALSIVERYFAPDTQIEGSGAYAAFDGWECTVTIRIDSDGNNGRCDHGQTGIGVGMRSAPSDAVRATVDEIRRAAEARDLDALVAVAERYPDLVYNFDPEFGPRHEWENSLARGEDIFAEILGLLAASPAPADGMWFWPASEILDPCAEYGDPDCYYGYRMSISDDGTWNTFVIGD